MFDADKNYVEVVLTGGPGSGKSSSIPYLTRHYSQRGIRVLHVPELATTLMSSGISDLGSLSKSNPQAYGDIQGEMMLMQLSLRTHYQKLAKSLAPEPVLLLFDRGPMDPKAYMPDKLFWQIAKQHNLDLQTLRDSYDLVVHLVTAADGAPEYYTLENNPHRFETDLDQAIASDGRTLRAWLGYPRLRIVDNSTNFEGKMQRLVAYINGVVGGPEYIEYERRFLLSGPPPFDSRQIAEAEKISIEQFYLKQEDAQTTIRLRKWAQGDQVSYFWTRSKKLESGARQEQEAILNPNEYTHLEEQRDPEGPLLRKIRYCFADHGRHYQLDRIERDDNPDIWILEVKLASKDEKFAAPDFLDIDKEISDDDREYSSWSLAKM